MEDKSHLESGFRINNLILVESNFYRINNVSFSSEVNNNLDVTVDVSVKDKIITVSETVTIIQKFQNVEQVTIAVRMIGIFESIGDSKLTDFNEFGKINGAAIIFPFIREHITNLSLKSGIGPIIIPPINFTKNS